MVWLALSACSHKSSSLPAPPTRTPGGALRDAPLAATPLEAGSGDIGAAAPTLPLGAGQDGSWVALCQARNDTDDVPGIEVRTDYHGNLSGDRMVPYFVRGGGLGNEIDRIVASSRGGKYVAFIRDRQLVLFDSRAGTTSVLPDADLRGARALGGAAALSFSLDGTRAVYFRPAGAGASVVIRELATSKEREVVLPRGIPVGVDFDGLGPWARLDVVTEDTDHDGVLKLPEVATNLPIASACAGPAVSYSTFGVKGDRPTRMWFRVDTGELVESPSLVRPVNEGMLMRAADDAILFGTEAIIPGSCHAVVKAVFPDPLRVVALCKGDQRELPVELFGPGFHLETKATLNPSFESPVELMDTTSYCSAHNGCIDVRDGTLVDLHGGTYRDRHENALYLEIERDNGGFAFLDPKRGSYRAFAGKRLQVLGEHQLVADNELFEIETGKILGKFAEVPTFIDAQARGLVSVRIAPESPIPDGPLRWVSASAP